MRWRLVAAVALAQNLVSGCAVEQELPPVHQIVRAAEARDVSLIQLIANPGDFHGARVRLQGFCKLEFEGNALYLHRQDHQEGIYKNAVWLSLGWPVPDRFKGVNERYVLVEGTFDAKNTGHMGIFAGGLGEISRLEVMPTREQLRSGAKP